MKTRTLIFASLFFLLASTFAQNSQNDFSPQQEDAPDPLLQKSFTIVDAPHQYDLNPHTASYSSEAQILTNIYEGLFSYHPATLEPQYALATSHRISRNKLRWTFTLRENARFSDGFPLTAHDVKEAWLNLLAEKNAPYASLLDIIQGAAEYRNGKGLRSDVSISALNDTTLTVTLTTPASYLPAILCHSAFSVCKKNLNVYSGAYKIKSNKNGVLVLEKNTFYWDAKQTHLQEIKIIQSDAADENAYLFNIGMADWISGNATTNKLLKQHAIQITGQFATEYLFFKCRKNSIWNNPDFRIALLEAAPWEKLREQSFIKATTLVYPLNGYTKPTGFSFTDQAEGAALLESAKKNAGIPKDKRLSLTFAIIDTEYMRKMAETLVDAWSKIGVDVKIQTTPPARYLASIPDWEADLFSYTWIGDFADPLAFLELFRSNSTLNVTNWKNDKYDTLLTEAAKLTDHTRTKLLTDAEQVLLDSGLILPISHPISFNVIDLNEVGGWQSNAFDIHLFKYMFKKKTLPTLPNIASAQ